MKKRICKNICIMLLSVFLLNGCKTEPVEENDATEYSEAIYTCEVVEDITQEENVAFSEVLLSCGLSCYWMMEGEQVGVEYKYLFFLNDGRVYCGEEKYKFGQVEWFFENCDDELWERLENVFYLGKLSAEDIRELNRIIDTVNFNSETIYYYEEPECEPCAQEIYSTDEYSWENIAIYAYYMSDENTVEWFGIECFRQRNNRAEVFWKTTDQNALAIMPIVEESPFYTTWLELIFEGAE